MILAHIEADGRTVVDTTTGATTTGLLLGDPRGPMSGFLHAPADRPTGLVVVCQPILAEGPRNYRRELMVARDLAHLGVATIRFHYRGAGQSHGDGPAGFEQMVQDALVATQRGLDMTGAVPVGFLGTCLGAAVAAEVAMRHPAAPVVLWAPAVDPVAYFREVLRARLVSDIKSGGPGESVGTLIERLAHGEQVDVAGYPLTSELYVGSVARPITAELGNPDRSILVVELSRRDRIRTPLADLVRDWSDAGADVDVRVIPHDEPWWFGAAGREGMLETVVTATEMVSITVDYLVRQLGGEEVA